MALFSNYYPVPTFSVGCSPARVHCTIADQSCCEDVGSYRASQSSILLASDPDEIRNSQVEEEPASTVKKSLIWRVLSIHGLGLSAFLLPMCTSMCMSSFKGAAEPLVSSASWQQQCSLSQTTACEASAWLLYMLANTFACFFFLKPQAVLFDV